MSSGGYDPGDQLGGRGTAGAALGTVGAAALGAGAIWLARGRAATWSRPALLALGAALGLWLWTLLSIGWAAAPDLAWIEANRTAVAVAALAVGLGLGTLLPRAGEKLAVGVSAAAVVPLGWAVVVAVFPDAGGGTVRLADPLGYWNALALVAAFAVPGALALAAGPRSLGVAGRLIAAGWLAVLVTIATLTLSRGGLLAFAVAALVALTALAPRGPAVGALVAGLVGAVLPVTFGLTDDTYTSEALSSAARSDAGLGLGWRLLVGVAVAVGVAEGLRRVRWGADRLDSDRVRTALAGLAVLVGLALVVGVAVSGSVRDGLGEGGTGAVSNDSSRVADLGTNNRPEWWGEALRGFADAPLAGQGGGGFALVHLQERPEGSLDAFNPQEPHQLELRLLSGLGVVGLALFLAAVGAVAWGGLRARAAGRAGDAGLPVAIALAFLVQAQVDWSFAIPALVAPAAAAAGVIVSGATTGRGGLNRRQEPLLAIGLVAIVATMAVSGTLPWLSQRATASAEDALVAGDPGLALDRAETARSLNPYALRPLLIEGLAYADLRLRAEELGAFQEMTRTQPDNPSAWKRFALALGRDPRAIEAWRQVLRLNPEDRRARAELGLL